MNRLIRLIFAAPMMCIGSALVQMALAILDTEDRRSLIRTGFLTMRDE